MREIYMHNAGTHKNQKGLSMYTLLYSIYFATKRYIRKHIDQRSWQLKTARKIIGEIEVYYNIYLKRKYEKHPRTDYGITKEKRKQKLIVSLTSFPARINNVWLTIESLFQQTVKADEIILWLARDQFDGKESLPKNLLAAEKRGLTIRFCDDLRSHKKYYYVMQEYPDDLIVLTDDDTFYPRDMLEKLCQLHEKYPEDIISSTSAILPEGLKTYPSQWHAPDMNSRIVHSKIAQPFSGQGTLYPPKSLDPQVFEKGLFMSLCPYADDLWLLFMASIANTAVTAVYPYRDIPVTIYGTGETSLWQINGKENKNDEQWQAILNWYGEDNVPEVVNVDKTA